MYTKLPNGQIVYEEDYSCIVEPQNGKGGIFIGNLEASQNLKTLRKNGIRAVLTAAKGIDLGHSKTDIPFYLQVPGEDRDGFDLTKFFPQAIKFIQESLENTSIMVHCLAGVSRSVCLVLAYFMKCQGMTYDEAYRLVKSKRKIIHPNDGFIAQLKKYQTQLRSDVSSSPARNTQQHGYSASPTKRNYQFYYNPEKTHQHHAQQSLYSRYQSKQQQQHKISDFSLNYESPSKRNPYPSSLHDSPSPRKHRESHYDYSMSPSKQQQQQRYAYQYKYDTEDVQVTPGYESPRRRRAGDNYSPSKKYEYDYDTPEPVRKDVGIRRLMSYGGEYSAPEHAYMAPEMKSRPSDYIPRGRSTSDIKAESTSSSNNPNLAGGYDQLRHTSTVQLSEELDNKIAMIRKKYAEYTQSSVNIKGSRVRETIEPKVNNFFDENDIGLSSKLGLKKLTSDNEYGMIKQNSYLRGSQVGAGLGLRKLNSLRDAY